MSNIKNKTSKKVHNVSVPIDVKKEVAKMAEICGVSLTALVGEILAAGLTDSTKSSIMNKKGYAQIVKEDAIIQNAKERKKAIQDGISKRLNGISKRLKRAA